MARLEDTEKRHNTHMVRPIRVCLYRTRMVRKIVQYAYGIPYAYGTKYAYGIETHQLLNDNVRNFTDTKVLRTLYGK